MTEAMHGHVYPSIFDARNWTESITNLTLLSNVDLQKHLGQILNFSFPVEHLPVFLHEATHHWCFHTPVGTALSLLPLRAKKRAYAWARGVPGIGLKDAANAVIDICRYEILSALLRPLTEGMALFAEFDAWPGSSDFLPTPLSRVVWFSGSPSEESRDPTLVSVNNLLADTLRTMRSQPGFYLRKEHLLTQPVSTSGGGYLLGYLAVKSMWHETRSRCPRLADPALFLMFLRSFVYEFFFIVSGLLKANAELSDLMDLLCNRLHFQLWMLFIGELDEKVARYEREVAEIERDLHGGNLLLGKLQLLPSINGSETREEDIRLYDNLLEEVCKRQPYEPKESPAELDYLMFVQRELMLIGSTPCTMHNIGDGTIRCKYDSNLTIDLPAVGHDTNAASEGSLEVFMVITGPNRAFLAVAASTEARLMGLMFQGHVDHGTVSQFNFYLTSRREIEVYAMSTHRILDTVLNMGSHRPWLEALEDFRSSAPQRMYEQYIVQLVSVDKQEECLALLRQRGLYDILGRDGNLIKGLALLGICNSIEYSYSQTAETFGTYGLELQPTLQGLRRCSTQFGITLLEEESDLPRSVV